MTEIKAYYPRFGIANVALINKYSKAVSLIYASSLLIASGVTKFLSPSVTSKWFGKAFSIELSTLVVRAFSGLEIAVAVAILLPVTRSIAAKTALVMSSIFFGLAAARLLFGLQGNCGCFGFLALPPTVHALIALGLIGSSLVVSRN